MKVYYSTIVWNSIYLERFVDLCIPSLLTNKNIAGYNSKYFICTNADGYDFLKNNKNFNLLADKININFFIFDDKKSYFKKSKYKIVSEIQKLLIINAFKERYEFFFHIYPDLIYSNGFLDKSNDILKKKDIIVCPAINVNSMNLSADEFITNGFSNEYLSNIALRNLSYFYQTFYYDNLKTLTTPIIIRKMHNENLIINGFFFHPVAFKLKYNSKLLDNFSNSIDEQHIYKSFLDLDSYYIPDHSFDLTILSIEDDLSKRNQEAVIKLRNTLESVSNDERIEILLNYAETNTIKINREIFASNYQIIKDKFLNYNESEISQINLIYTELFLPDSYLKNHNKKRFKSRKNNIFKYKSGIMLSKFKIGDFIENDSNHIILKSFLRLEKYSSKFQTFTMPLEGIKLTTKDFRNYIVLRIAHFIRDTFPRFYYFLRAKFPSNELKHDINSKNLKRLSFASVIYLLIFK